MCLLSAHFPTDAKDSPENLNNLGRARGRVGFELQTLPSRLPHPAPSLNSWEGCNSVEAVAGISAVLQK